MEAEATTRQLLGLTAEDAAERYLRDAGYRIQARNFSCKYGELDIVAEKDGTLCFVEVRMRSTATWGDPSQTITFSKQRKVVKAALHYLVGFGISDKAIRFDVISVVGRGEKATVEHIPNAFDAGF